MQLPENFSFSQHNLQDYVDCKFRFLLKHVKRLEWPAVESEPVMLQEARMELGQQFHRLVQQYFIGIDPETLRASIPTSELAEWWEAFLGLKLKEQEGDKHAEKILAMTLNGHRLLSKYDLLIQNSPGACTIYDWKTSNHQPSTQQLLTRLQSRVYPLVLWHSLMIALRSGNTEPEIEMIYWFPTSPGIPRRFKYTQQKFEEDLEFVTLLADEIQQLEQEGFTRTTDSKRCTYCRYRSLCDRGISAGSLEPGLDEDPDELEFHLDFDAL